MLLESLLIISWFAAAYFAGLRYVESRQWWTVRLRLSCLFPATTFLASTVVGLSALLWEFVDEYGVETFFARLVLGSSVTLYITAVIRYLLPLVESRAYINVRWKAWTGPSRTGIPSNLTRYIGDQQDWLSMAGSCPAVTPHPVEKYVSLVTPRSSGLSTDPTALLNARLASDEEAETVWVPHSPDKVGAYEPVANDRSVSLLWGEHNGFRPRCSRAIIAIPPQLLSYQPTLKSGADGRPVCLAYAILARNKGLAPHSLVCNLHTKQSYGQFEENSVLWPRPAKTLRSIYCAEFARSFSGLGESYITAATELALLLADADYNTISDWLDGQMEHQDLALNNTLARLGVRPEELARLYRGHHAAMLVSLSLHRPGIRVRPEIEIYKALCVAEGASASPPWLSADVLAGRVREETLVLGQRGAQLIEAII